ncbi:helix-turn-helix transcriptional regulator [Streptomyces sp. NBC_01310]|uniref:helix-turn-helix domain-containing protein n=1 Tax=Streptomyces sp. NBC_01310 TaxID=2903820 RepID=UPI0035B637D9|nr:helix-turn-helix transcriptional regulator [Streptomyces sp. NBC_01310]
MTGDELDGTPAAMGPRLRAARERHGATRAGISCATGISPSTLSRIETGRRKPTLEVMLQLAKEYGVSLDELTGTAPAPVAGPRTTASLSFGDDKAVLPLTRYVGGLHAHKHVLPADARDVRVPQGHGVDLALLPQMVQGSNVACGAGPEDMIISFAARDGCTTTCLPAFVAASVAEPAVPVPSVPVRSPARWRRQGRRARRRGPASRSPRGGPWPTRA